MTNRTGRKYSNLIELAEGFRNGDLEGYILVLDNDSSFLQWVGDNPHEEGTDKHDRYQDKMTEKGEKLFLGNGYRDLGDACTAAGIPNEWV